MTDERVPLFRRNKSDHWQYFMNRDMSNVSGGTERSVGAPISNTIHTQHIRASNIYRDSISLDSATRALYTIASAYAQLASTVVSGQCALVHK